MIPFRLPIFFLAGILAVATSIFLLSCEGDKCPKLEELDQLIGPMVQVDGGTFQMGSPDTVERADDEVLHTVTVSGFRIQSAEVTQELWKTVMGSNPSADKTWKDLPVTNVSWNDALKFIDKLNTCTGRNYRLPTEAEWEYAAKGGNRSKGYVFSGSNNIEEVGWCEQNSGERIHVIREKQPNELGIYDMSGNVWEWCADGYAPYRTDAVGSQNPKGPDNSGARVLRGGSWYFNARRCRSAYRYGNGAEIGSNYYGFRLVLSSSSPGQ